jgi:hypothetical protein
LEALSIIRRHLMPLDAVEIHKLTSEISDYILFRARVGQFLDRHFAAICTQKCYQNRLSACCSKDGIITFFADMVINALKSNPIELDLLEHAIRQPANDFKCIYLSETGCVWKIKPVVCEFFLCDEAEKKAFDQNPEAQAEWKDFHRTKKIYTWPDRPVLFESLERYFMDMGYESPLMYLHNSPGLVRIRKLRDGDNKVERL